MHDLSTVYKLAVSLLFDGALAPEQLPAARATTLIVRLRELRQYEELVDGQDKGYYSAGDPRRAFWSREARAIGVEMERRWPQAELDAALALKRQQRQYEREVLALGQL